MSSLEVEDASPTSAALQALQRWVEVIAEREMDKIAAKCARYERFAHCLWVRACTRLRRLRGCRCLDWFLLAHGEFFLLGTYISEYDVPTKRLGRRGEVSLCIFRRL
jgi:hypothetical protein